MKVLVILAVLFAYAQATSEPITVQQMAARALTHCLEEKGLDKDKIKGYFSHDILPEDDPEFADFFVCYWTKATVIQSDGTFNHLFLGVAMPQIIKDKYPSVTEDKAHQLSTDALEHCKDSYHADTLGLKGIKYRNCLMKYVKKHQ